MHSSAPARQTIIADADADAEHTVRQQHLARVDPLQGSCSRNPSLRAARGLFLCRLERPPCNVTRSHRSYCCELFSEKLWGMLTPSQGHTSLDEAASHAPRCHTCHLVADKSGTMLLLLPSPAGALPQQHQQPKARRLEARWCAAQAHCAAAAEC